MILVALVAAFTLPLTAPASAQFGRGPVARGEPTDPDGALLMLDEADIDLADYGLATTTPSDEAAAQSWFESLIELLCDLGLLPDEGKD